MSPPSEGTKTRRMKTNTWIVGVALIVAAQLQAQPVQAKLTSRADRALLTELVAADDARNLERGRTVFERGIGWANSFFRAYTARGLGRLGNHSGSPLLTAQISAPAAEVRPAAADALAQSVARPLAAT